MEEEEDQLKKPNANQPNFLCKLPWNNAIMENF